MAPKVCFLGAVRRRTMICCRNVKISASSAARDQNRSTTAQTMSLKRYLITDQHRPILGQPPVNRFATGTGGSGGVVTTGPICDPAVKFIQCRLRCGSEPRTRKNSDKISRWTTNPQEQRLTQFS